MKNLSYSPQAPVIEKEVAVEVQDDRVFISYEVNEVSFFLSSNGKILIFTNVDMATKYLKKIKHLEYLIESITDFDIDMEDTILIN